ncbi:ssDNA-binding protein, mitochondrial [Emydomyces testavorans]|uniref:SsDNA-binding protein, mitochondrial n=1 Tax=Emydomyces testavorans TaxID=2070801 RepID=A0AAF0DDI6_9EURO|nr:ssDNA-binding protein, mitochondrial [Emydomyces testavorans]
MFRLTRLAPTLRTASVPRAFTTSAPRDIASITIAGRLAAPAELRTGQNGREYVRYVVGSSSGPNRDVSWFRVTSFAQEGKGRDHLLSLPKGTLMFVEGDASISGVEDSEGRKNFNLSVVQRAYHVLQRPRPNPEANAESSAEGSAEGSEPMQ